MTRGPKPTTLRGRKNGARELRAWVSAAEYEHCEAEATAAGLSLGDLVRARMLPAATPVLDAPKPPG